MRLNCLLVASHLWWRSHLRSGIGVKRSEGLRGLIPHFFYVRERKSKELVLIDYIPRQRKHGLLDRGDSVLVFDGLYRVRIYRLVATATADTLPEAKRSALSLRRS